MSSKNKPCIANEILKPHVLPSDNYICRKKTTPLPPSSLRQFSPPHPARPPLFWRDITIAAQVDSELGTEKLGRAITPGGALKRRREASHVRPGVKFGEKNNVRARYRVIFSPLPCQRCLARRFHFSTSNWGREHKYDERGGSWRNWRKVKPEMKWWWKRNILWCSTLLVIHVINS